MVARVGTRVVGEQVVPAQIVGVCDGLAREVDHHHVVLRRPASHVSQRRPYRIECRFFVQEKHDVLWTVAASGRGQEITHGGRVPIREGQTQSAFVHIEPRFDHQLLDSHRSHGLMYAGHSMRARRDLEPG